MRQNPTIIRKIQQSERENRFFFGVDERERQAMRNRTRSGELARVFRNVYAAKTYYSSLSPRQRTLHLIRTLQLMHPTWRFASLSAASIHGFEYSYELDRRSPIFLATQRSSNRHHTKGIELVHVGKAQHSICHGIQVTCVEQTLIDCATRLSFDQSLGIFDSALRSATTTKAKIAAATTSLSAKRSAIVDRVLHYADPDSENGGESHCRAVIIEAGFTVPSLQQEFFDPDHPNTRYRVDFLWHLRGGRLVVLEYDGMEKYTNPAMTNNHNTRSVVDAERRRAKVLTGFGATIVRTDYQEVIARQPLIDKLALAGIPPSAATYVQYPIK